VIIAPMTTKGQTTVLDTFSLTNLLRVSAHDFLPVFGSIQMRSIQVP